MLPQTRSTPSEPLAALINTASRNVQEGIAQVPCALLRLHWLPTDCACKQSRQGSEAPDMPSAVNNTTHRSLGWTLTTLVAGPLLAGGCKKVVTVEVAAVNA